MKMVFVHDGYVSNLQVGDNPYRVSTAFRRAKSETMVFGQDGREVTGLGISNVPEVTAFVYNLALQKAPHTDINGRSQYALHVVERTEAAVQLCDRLGLSQYIS